MSESPAFCCGEYTFSVDGDQDLVRLVVEAFADLSCNRAAAASQWQFTADDGLVTLTINGTKTFSSVSRRAMPAQAVSSLTREVLDHEQDLLHLHAAAVVDGGGALVVAGSSGSGKSTLCTALVSSGWEYVSDEIVSVEPRTLLVSSFPKPISIKSHAIDTVVKLSGIKAPKDISPWALRASELGSLAVQQPYDARTLVLYKYQRDESTSIVPVHRATMIRELLADGQDAERMGHRSLLVAALLAAGANCLRVSSGDATDVAESLRHFHGDVHHRGSVSALDPIDTNGAGPLRASCTSSLIIDGRCLIFDSANSRIVELDELTSAWWALCDGTPIDVLTREYAEQFEVTTEEAHERGQAAIDQLRELDILAG